jgi:hypothetical protein
MLCTTCASPDVQLTSESDESHVGQGPDPDEKEKQDDNR